MSDVFRFPLPAIILVSLLAVACEGEDSAEAEAEPGFVTSMTISDVGLETPESVLYDAEADVYLVSNIAGDPLGVDDNGFISRVLPSGEVETLRWIDGAAANVTLHAPKGLAIQGDTLFVADIDSVRAFDRTSGAPIRSIGIPGATFLNDVAVGPAGVYVTDTGGGGDESAGAGAIYLIGPQRIGQIGSSAAVERPNGITVGGAELFVVSSGGRSVLRLPSGGGDITPVFELPAGRLDGVLRLPSGEFFVSSWEAGRVYHVRPGGFIQVVAENLESPADVGFDTRRRRVLIPLLTENRIEIRWVP
jgi:sugar lactone lactonase YvrE